MGDEMSWDLYLSLSGMKFLEFTVWGAWAPVLASRILGPLKMSGKQLGWIYATLPLACVVAPMAAGQIVDRWCPTELYMAAAHLLGGVFLLAASRATRFTPLFLLMLGHCLCFAPTLAMVNSLTFAALPTRVIDVTELTIDTNARLTAGGDRSRVPRQAVTLGMKRILAAREILLLACFPEQEEPLRRMQHGRPTPELPASYLLDHPHSTILYTGDRISLEEQA